MDYQDLYIALDCGTPISFKYLEKYAPDSIRDHLPIDEHVDNVLDGVFKDFKKYPKCIVLNDQLFIELSNSQGSAKSDIRFNKYKLLTSFDFLTKWALLTAIPERHYNLINWGHK